MLYGARTGRLRILQERLKEGIKSLRNQGKDSIENNISTRNQGEIPNVNNNLSKNQEDNGR